MSSFDYFTIYWDIENVTSKEKLFKDTMRQFVTR